MYKNNRVVDLTQQGPGKIKFFSGLAGTTGLQDAGRGRAREEGEAGRQGGAWPAGGDGRDALVCSSLMLITAEEGAQPC